MSVQTATISKLARTFISRRPIDSSLLNVAVNGGVVYITGVIRLLRTQPQVNLQEEMNHIATALRTKPEFHDVVWDVTVRS